MKYRCTQCRFRMETKGMILLDYDPKCPKCEEKRDSYTIDSHLRPKSCYMKLMEEKDK